MCASAEGKMSHGKPAPLLIKPCDPPELCLGDNRCADVSTGVMCAGCLDGYARVNFGFAPGSALGASCALPMLSLSPHYVSQRRSLFIP